MKHEPTANMYHFNLDDPGSVERIMALLPVLDTEIIQSLYQECFPGYPVEDLAPRMARIELKGFFMDYLARSAGRSL